MGAAAPQTRPGRAARGSGRDPRAGAGADPQRADAGVAVHVLPRRRDADGVRSRGGAADAATRAAVRRRAPVELRRRSRRPTAGSSSVSTTSTRRCPARSSGTSSAWSRASRWPGAIADFGAKQRATVAVAAGRSYREAMIEFAEMRALDLWYARLDVEALTKRWAAQGTAKQLKRWDRIVAKAHAKDQSTGARSAQQRRRRPAADHQRPAADRADRGAAGQRGADRRRGPRAHRAPLVSAHAWRATAAACSSASPTRTPRARWSASAASARAPGSC